jgi:Zn-dependent M28 family amino/carboxypeptidase
VHTAARVVVCGFLATLIAPAAADSGSRGTDGYRFARSLAKAGPRPTASAAERRAQMRVRSVFRRNGLRIASDRFRVPGKGRSRNIIGIRETPARCLVILMAHADTTAGSPGALDNASGLGALVDITPQLRRVEPACDVWLVATGAEERIYTGRRDHMGATALARRVFRQKRIFDLTIALSLDEVGAGRQMWLRSSSRARGQGVARTVRSASRGSGLSVRWVRDEGSGNSDHREFQIRRLPAAKLGVVDNPRRHSPADTARHLDPRTFSRVRRLLARLVAE